MKRKIAASVAIKTIADVALRVDYLDTEIIVKGPALTHPFS